MSFWTRLAGRARPDPADPGAPAGARSERDASPTHAAASEALVRRLRQGDAGALEPLYRSESPGVYRYALALCGQSDLAADAMQEAFVQFAGRPEGWDPGRGPLGAYLAGVARHHLLARWRDLPVAHDEDADERHQDPADAPEQQLVRAQDQARVWAALQTLPWTFREAIVLVDLQERAYAEAARIAGVELNTLRTRLHRGRARLLAALQDASRPLTSAPADANERSSKSA
ncbi:RNA polymerase sigma factor [Roseateles chitinivorans]|uniref:RNA polymerase sigma factor n=1 Tax=Roseateles chitinivorans TaxID=2917965 RepID=UPI003D66ECA8